MNDVNASHYNLPPPQITDQNRPFWDGAKQNRLMVLRCEGCGRHRFPPVPCCKRCLSTHASWTEVPGRGTLWSWAVIHRPYFPGALVPYQVAIVELDEGPLLGTNIINARDENMRVGAPVRVAFKQIENDLTLPVFELVD
ncbi:Zn-ribbon domain-containing OB-fold protein [Alsobacter sp. SYSU M60028]|uniref:Zn-ribbon domain-containing OB-fold protein n=1 Tax=Alsobacter ponti TaxID=2962936 RepID=A0ABT1LAH5_9HYPH|nr:Zn-ribbon domain-containing OB-fold protein [Alsobacter ponti]MCP8937760.1 Zn-ribbon domain-containing OB-fold protein [Alsobacter ponti]